jgi:hypothetical protein
MGCELEVPHEHKRSVSMSNRQLGWDDQRIRDRLSPREIAEANKEAASQQEAEGEQPESPKGWVPDDMQRSKGKENRRDKY